MKKKSISETKSTNGLSTDEIRHIIQHETLNPNIPLAIVQEKWYADKQLSDRTIRSIFKNICVECEIDIKGRNICNHSERKTCIFELFDLGIPENTEALSEIVNRLEGLPLLPSSSNTI
ncbi:22171_t:CDS:2, partial [Rhizophagus irregularis]